MSLSEVQLQAVLDVIHFTPGRRTLTFRQVREEAESRGLSDLVKCIDAFIPHDRQVVEIRAAFRKQRMSGQTGDPVLVTLDNRADRLLGAIFRDCRDMAHTFGMDNPLRDKAREVVDELFPGGVQVFTQMIYADQHVEMERLVGKLTKRFQTHVKDLGLVPKVDELRRLTEAYGQRLQVRLPTEEVTYQTFRVEDAKGQDNLLELIARIIGIFPTNGEKDAAARTALLSPILHQQEEIRAYYRSRRAVRDVDPETGEEEDPPDEPETPPGDSGGTAGGGTGETPPPDEPVT